MESTTQAERFDGQVALVTGAGSGIGRATALKFAEQGARVIICDLSPERVHETEAEINEQYPEAAKAFVTNITDEEQVKQAVQQGAAHFGGLHIVFANAGINGAVAPIDEISYEDWQRTINTNLGGTFLTVKYALPFLKQNGGSIVITSSINGNTTFASFGMSAYSTSKAGQVAFAKMAALELARSQIRVNVICPGAISTNIDQSTERNESVEKIAIPVEFPLGRHPLAGQSGTVENVANLVTFLSSSEASHITGAQIVIDGAESLLC
ncbi:SDR family NAD(P)-dependent oxidoreductase [Paenibacillus campi]|uniref:SDR family oxidoreductase n=1 Tax=Paenibacillus campi TaxID=3106031 RepID=UPI002AFDEBFC|nr:MULTISPECIES: SDR family NAD(P)-dependent oxidoreductase [unclassified Paenibacillus]